MYLFLPSKGLVIISVTCFFLQQLVADAKSVVIVYEPRLFPIINSLYPAIECIARDDLTVEKIQAHNRDYFLCIGSLGLVYASILSARAKEACPPRSKAAFLPVVSCRESLPISELTKKKPFIGISWRSIKIMQNRYDWYCAAEQFASALKGIDAYFINLQHGHSEEESLAFKQYGISLIQPEGINLKDDQLKLAQLISSLDAVVSAPTALSELAGATGVPVYLLSVADIRWFMAEKHIKGFYPNTRVFSKSILAGWDAAIEDLAQTLSDDLRVD
jgi:hypothetical protein